MRSATGRVLRLDGWRWVEPAGPADERLLQLVDGPVLDVGCGPGRHVLALARRGIVTLGIDVSPPALALARRGGAPVLERSIFDRVPATGRWGTALLLDGNLGIGGCPTTLLRRVRELLRSGGRLLVEVSSPGERPEVERVRFESDGFAGPWFSWAHVSIDSLAGVAHEAGLAVAREWCDDDRWFAWLG
ncbi:MAG TPA: class I SAM-dependent methyltransferase [Acidimicrobiia bacterium]